MNKKIVSLAMVILTVAMLVSFYKPVQATNGSRYNIEFVWYPAGVDSSYAALKAGAIDILDWSLTEDQMKDAEKDANLQLVKYASNSLWEIDINNNKTILTYGPSETSATAIPQVRQAIACLIDKPTAIIQNILHFYGVQIDAPVTASQTSVWADPSVVGSNYPYILNVAKAVDYLGSLGFNDTNGDNYLEFPSGWVNVVADSSLSRYLSALGNVYSYTYGEPLGHTDGTQKSFFTQFYPIKAGSVTVKLNSTLVPPANYTVNLATGEITFNTAPKTCYIVYATYTYDANTVWGTSHGRSTKPSDEPLVVVIRNTDPLRLAVGRYAVAQLDGGPSGPTASILYGNARWAHWNVNGGAFGTTGTTCEGPRTYTSPKVMGNHDYNLYTGGWTVGRYPTYCFSLFNTMFCYPYGANYVTGTEWAIGNPDYIAEMDPLSHDIYYCVNIPASIAACKIFTKYFVDNCVNIMLWSSASFNAWRKELCGVVNEQGYGIINDFTFLNAYKNTSTPIIVGEPETWSMMNPMYAQYVFEQDYLGRIVGGTIAVNPYDISIDEPWMAQDWQVGTWFDDRTNSTKTAVTYWFRPDCGWAEPVSGTFEGFFNSEDFAANMWFTYAYSDSWQWADTMDINHINVTSNYQVTVYFDDYSYWFQYEPTYPIMMPATVITNDYQLCGNETDTFLGSDLATPVDALPGYKEYAFTSNSVVEVINATKNGNLIYEGTDFYIRTGYDQTARCVFVPVNASKFLSTDTIKITYYYAKTIVPGGSTTLGTIMVGSSGVPATLYSCGYVYPVTLSDSTSYLKSNPYFFLEVPPVGEIDWSWNWVGATKPRSGYYRIDILDVVLATTSYCHRGDGKYDPVYFPGADLDSYDLCHIGILDVTSITGKYYWTYGTPKPNTLGADDVRGTVTATWPTGLSLGTPHQTYNLIFAYNSGTGAVTASLISTALNVGWVEYSGKAIVIIDYRVSIIIEISFEHLDSTGSSASTTWDSLNGATNVVTNSRNMNVNLNTGTGSVTASSNDGTPHTATGSYWTNDVPPKLQIFDIKLGK